VTISASPFAPDLDPSVAVAPATDPWVCASAEALAEGVRRGTVTAGDVAATHLDRVALVEPLVRALVRAFPAPGEPSGPASGRAGLLAGVPVVVKDNIDVAGQPTTSGSAHPCPPADRDAVVVERLRAAGATLLGHGNMDELAMGASTQTSGFGRSRNPWDTRRSAGGSSGGCAVAVAAHEAPLAVGTDTGGSVREPAAQCGLVGMAPSPGLVPTHGVTPFARALDRVGPLARSTGDLALLLAVLASRPELAAATRAAGDPGIAPLRGLRVGLPAELWGSRNRPGVIRQVRLAADTLTALGARVEDVSIPSAGRALATYLALTSAACVETVEAHTRRGPLGAEAARRLQRGRWLRTGGSAELVVAGAARNVLRGQVDAAWATCDLLLSPTMPTTAPVLDAHDAARMADPMEAPYTDCWTVVANLCGLPALTLPVGRSDDGMPVGAMLMAPAGHDAVLLATAAHLEATGIDG
jgi:aspartyl-tRNA(Asn)/glutamyl-tRNA(Gln) amidotransferase subunit A